MVVVGVMGELSSWIQTALLYLWLAGAVYLFYLWTQMCQTIFKALETISNANVRLVNASDQFSEQVSGFLDTAGDVVEQLGQQLMHTTTEANPLLDEDDDVWKWKTD